MAQPDNETKRRQCALCDGSIVDGQHPVVVKRVWAKSLMLLEQTV